MTVESTATTTTTPTTTQPNPTISTDREASHNRVRLVFAKSNCVRAKQIGFLCLVSFPLLPNSASLPPGTNKAFVWIGKSDIDQTQLPTFRRIAKKTRDLFGPNPPPSPVSPIQPVQPPRASSPLDFLFGSSSPSSASTPSNTDHSTPPPQKTLKSANPLSINTSPLDDFITLPQSASLFPLASLKSLVFQVALSLDSAGNEACLVNLEFSYTDSIETLTSSNNNSKNNTINNNNDESNEQDEYEDSNTNPDILWFDQNQEGSPANTPLTLESIVSELHVWLVKTCARGLQPVLEPDSDNAPMSSSSSSSSWPPTFRFLVLDLSDLGKTQDGTIRPPISTTSEKRNSEWPQVPSLLPTVSETSTVYRLGKFGLGVASAIVGPSISSKVEGMTRNAAWDVLDQFSKVTKFAQDTGRQVVEHPLARPVLPLIPTQITNLLLSSQEAEQLMSEYDSAHIYLAKFADSIQDGVKKRLKRKPLSDLAGRTDAAGNEIDTTDCYDFDKLSVGIIPKRVPMGNALSGEQWVSLFDESGKLALPEDEMRSIIFNQGVHPDCKRDVWKFLLKVYAWDSTERERVERLKGLTAQYESMKRQWQTILTMETPPFPLQTDTTAATATTTTSSSSSPTKATTPVGDESLGGDIVSKIKERKNRVEKDVIRTDRTTPYFQGIPADNEILLKSPTSPSPSSPSSSPPTLSKNLEMLKNVLLTYTIYNFDLGYVQGMNDLLSPILETMDDEVEAFWCFVGWMELKKENFSRDQEGMRNQLRLLEGLIKLVDPLLHEHLDRIDSTNLFCCFRWMLIVFKREFKFTDVQNTLWESIWSCPFSATHFHFFIALAILNKHRGHIMTQCTAFDELLKYLNELSEKEDVEDIVRRAEVLFVVFKRRLNEAMMSVTTATAAAAAGGGGGDLVQSAVASPLLVDSRRGSATSLNAALLTPATLTPAMVSVPGAAEAENASNLNLKVVDDAGGLSRSSSRLSVRSSDGRSGGRSVSPSGRTRFRGEELYALFVLLE